MRRTEDVHLLKQILFGLVLCCSSGLLLSDLAFSWTEPCFLQPSIFVLNMRDQMVVHSLLAVMGCFFCFLHLFSKKPFVLTRVWFGAILMWTTVSIATYISEFSKFNTECSAPAIAHFAFSIQLRVLFLACMNPSRIL